MSDDIVARLRAILHNDRSVELMNREAADEIERLRAERDSLRRQLDQFVGDFKDEYRGRRSDARGARGTDLGVAR